MKNILKISALVILFMLACADKDKNPIAPDDAEWQYPLKIGAQWEYLRELYHESIQPDSLILPVRSDTSVVYQIEVTVSKKATILDTVETFLLTEAATRIGVPSLVDETYYNNLKDGLYFYGYKGPGFVIPKATASKNRILFKGKYYNNIQQLVRSIEKALPRSTTVPDTMIYELPPVQALKYPLTIGEQWTYRQPYQPWHIDKKVVAKETITVPAGSFICLKIQ